MYHVGYKYKAWIPCTCSLWNSALHKNCAKCSISNISCKINLLSLNCNIGGPVRA